MSTTVSTLATFDLSLARASLLHSEGYDPGTPGRGNIDGGAAQVAGRGTDDDSLSGFDVHGRDTSVRDGEPGKITQLGDVVPLLLQQRVLVEGDGILERDCGVRGPAAVAPGVVGESLGLFVPAVHEAHQDLDVTCESTKTSGPSSRVVASGLTETILPMQLCAYMLGIGNWKFEI